MNTKHFDRIINRRGTDSLKYDRIPAGVKSNDGLLPLWVADMDFGVPDSVAQAIREVADFGIFGYVEPGAEYRAAVAAWWRERHGFEFDERAITVTPGVVFALAQAVRAFSGRGDAVLIQRPVYYPFTEVIENNGRRLVNSPLTLDETTGKYLMDFDDFERRLAEDRPRLFILCSPHNPVGRVWTKSELTRVGELCAAYDCLIISDEIHADFVYGENHHTVFSTIKNSFRENSIICTAPSKSFNLAGLQISNIIIEDAVLRRRYRDEINASGYSQPNIAGLAACRAAYEHGGLWFDELLAYLEGNVDIVRKFFSHKNAPAVGGRDGINGCVGGEERDDACENIFHPENQPPFDKQPAGIRLIEPEGTYLPWLDFRNLGISQKEADARLIQNAKVWLDSGTMFGPEGEGFQRINIACPRSVLEDALVRIAREFAV
jgi:cystathionine beta-lyase